MDDTKQKFCFGLDSRLKFGSSWVLAGQIIKTWIQARFGPLQNSTVQGEVIPHIQLKNDQLLQHV